MSKEYGLIIPGKNKQTVQAPGKRAAIFDEDSDSDETTPAKPTFVKPRENKQIKLTQEKLMEEDPTVYQYDEVYDDIEKKRMDSKLSRKDLERKPKYINNLLRAAERRKRENELRIEREVHREREAEGDKFSDKESYITPSYQKKLEELKVLEEEEKRQEYLETIGDVRKQGNLDGFYRHLYEQNVKNEDKRESDEEIKTETPEIKTEEAENKIEHKNKTKKRQYRTRDDSKSDDETVEVKKEHMPSNLDADSDFSIDSSDSEDETAKKKENKEVQVPVEPKIEKEEKIVEDTAEKDETKNVDVVKKEEEAKKPKIDIWKKRTVGEVFENARIRYFERLALRESG